MDNITAWLEKHLEPFAAKVAASKNVNAISKGFTTIIPITMVGSLISLINYIQIGNFQEVLISAGISIWINTIVNLTMNVIALYLVFSISLAKARISHDETESKSVAIISLLIFLLCVPLSEAGDLSIGWLGSKGIIIALIVGLIVPSLYRFLVEKKIVIRMPESVPSFIASSFKAILPTFVILVLCCLMNILVSLTGYSTLGEFTYALLSSPLQALSGSVWTYLFLSLITNLLWFFGIHGGNVTGMIIGTLFYTNTLENIAASTAGEALPHIVTTGFSALASQATVWTALSIVLIFVAKREDDKAIGKISAIPSFFGITEPVRFGLPLVANAALMIPTVLLTAFNLGITYLAVLLGLVSRPRIGGFQGLPLGLDAFLVGGFSAVILVAVLLVLDVLIWIPFIKVFENIKNKQEANG